MTHPAPIWITTAIACILLIACRANKEVVETATGQTAASVSATVQSDTAHWQLVYPKTAKTECDLWRKGNVYTLDTCEASWTVDTTFSVNVHISIKLDESDSDFTHMDYSERLKCPRGKPFVKFIDSLNQNKDVKRVDYHIPPILIKEQSPKTARAKSARQSKSFCVLSFFFSPFNLFGQNKTGCGNRSYL